MQNFSGTKSGVNQGKFSTIQQPYGGALKKDFIKIVENSLEQTHDKKWR